MDWCAIILMTVMHTFWLFYLTDEAKRYKNHE